MKLGREPDEVKKHVPEKCRSCSKIGQYKMKCRNTRYEYEVQVGMKLIAHKSMGYTCPFPERNYGVSFRQELPEPGNTVLEYLLS